MELTLASVALVAWALWGVPAFGAFVVCHLAVWLAAGLAAERGVRLPAGRPWFVAAAGVLAMWAVGPELTATEQLDPLSELLADRARVRDLPSIAPPVVAGDRPQAFFVHAPDARRVAVRFDGARAVEAADLGHGLFRADYDPRRDGAASGGAVEIAADGRAVKRAVTVVRPVPHPRGFCASPEDGVAATPSEETDEIAVVTRDGKLRRVATGDGPTDCALLPHGDHVAVSHRYEDDVWVIEAATEQVRARLPAGRGQVHLALAPDAGSLAVAVAGPQPKLRVFMLPPPGARVIPLAFEPDLIAFGPTDRVLVVSSKSDHALHRFVATASAANAAWSEDVAPLPLGRPAVALMSWKDGARVDVAVTDYRPEGGAGPNHYANDQILTIDVETWRVVQRSETEGASPAALTSVSSSGRAIAFAGSDEIALGPEKRIDVRGFAPRPVGIADLRGRIAVASAARATIAVIDEHSDTPIVHELAPDSRLGAAERRIRRGELAFWEATRSGLSCQTCHLWGDSDRAFHDIGHGAPRPTLSVRGIARTAPYLRGASYPAIDALEIFANTLLGGYESTVPDRAEALAAYVSSLPPADPDFATPLATQRAGVDAFVRARCSVCHTFPAFTNLAQYPAGFLFPEKGGAQLTDVPSLRGIRASAPYLHDGRARTIEDVLVRENGANRHGDVASLSGVERAALIAFLESL